MLGMIGNHVSRVLRRALQAFVVLLGGASAAAALADASCPPPPQAPRFAPGAAARALRQAPDRGVLWRIERDGRSSWLYGTLHIGKAPWVFPGPSIVQALTQSDVLALELDLTDPATLAVLTAPPDPAVAGRVLTAERVKRLARQKELACLPPDALAKLWPAMQVAALGALIGRADGFYSDFGVESVLTGFARTTGKPVLALETAEAQLKMLAGDSEAEQGQDIDDSLDELEAGDVRAHLALLADAWARSDRDKLDVYWQWCDCLRTPGDRRRMKRYLDDRNPGLADGIERLHAGGQRVFGAVGTLHMIGPQGLPALMAARGFAVTAVVPAPR